MSKRKDVALDRPAWRYRGVRRPGYTQVPDDYIDEVMAHLTGAEFKVLMYLTRRTLGFKRASDQISLNQLCAGIKKRDGVLLDHGTGLSRQAVLDALRRLGELGIVAEQQTIRDDGAYEAKTYTLLFDDPDPLAEADLPEGSSGQTVQSSHQPPLSSKQTGGSTEKTVRSAGLTALSTNRTGASTRKMAGATKATVSPLLNGRGGGNSVDPQKTVERETEKQERGISRVSKDPSTEEQKNGTSEEAGNNGDRLYNPHILNLIDDLSTQFHDDTALGSNRTRIMRIWARSELDDATFVDIMYESRRRTLRAANIQHQASNGDVANPNRMPYFFTVLQDLIDRETEGLRDGAP